MEKFIFSYALNLFLVPGKVMKNQTCNKFLRIGSFILAGIAVAVSCHHRLKKFLSDEDIANACTILTEIIESVLFITLLKNGLVKKSEWKQFWKYVAAAESRLQSQKNQKKRHNSGLYLSLIANAMLLLLLAIIAQYVVKIPFDGQIYVVLHYILCHMTIILWTVLVLIIQKIATLFKHTNMKLASIGSATHPDFIKDISHKNEETLTKLREIKQLYIFITKIADTFNSMFGSIMLFYIGETFSALITTLGIILDDSYVSPPRLYGLLIEAMIFSYGTIVIILVCDAASKAASEISITGFKLQESLLLNSQERQELYAFALYVRFSPVYFTAGGFFNITRKILFAFVSSLTTYFIVLVQFSLLE